MLAQPGRGGNGTEQIAGIICVIKTCGLVVSSSPSPSAPPRRLLPAAVDLFAAEATSNIGRKDTASLLCCLPLCQLLVHTLTECGVYKCSRYK